MRVIVLDTETTGLSPKSGDRIVEIGCIEMFSLRRTGKTFHSYINPERDVPQESTNITGLTTAFLKPFPVFAQIVDSFLEFIADSPLVIHNAAFDMKFLNAELGWQNRELLNNSRAIDTLQMARKQYPGSPASLNALCKRFEIDLSKREKHGALLDAELLCEVYIELMGGRQKTLSQSIVDASFLSVENNVINCSKIQPNTTNKSAIPMRTFPVSEAEELQHEKLIASLKDPLWEKYRSAE